MPRAQEVSTAPAARVIGGRYRLESAIGRGAMGYVWSGADELLQREVAVKELRLSLGIPRGGSCRAADSSRGAGSFGKINLSPR
ncbi:hypothetical protein [Saccharopolyspora pogona]|uniref:hypothetical protein n=1 Tax=Saccharopolyspora pogona TaxID=333966 RepID=UPI001685F3F5|nr:hypothetical protein [Saccharopolyspora pogona]